MLEQERMVETREVAGFDRLLLRGSLCCAEVYLEQGETESLRIEADANVLLRIETRVVDRRLVIRLRGSWLEKLGDWMANDLASPKIVFHIRVRELRGLDVHGASYIQVRSLRTDSMAIHWRGAGDLLIESLIARELYIEGSGAGSMEFAGQVEQQRVKMAGVGRYDGSGLMSDHAEVRVTGSSVASVCAREALTAIVHGVGVVEYAGDPLVRTRVTGAGSVVRVG